MSQLSHLHVFDAYVSLLAALGIWPVLVKLFRQDPLNPLESRLGGILASMFVLFVVRFPFVAYENHVFGILTYITAIALAFFIFLYFEGLLRRHMPFLLKLYMVCGSVMFTIDALMGNLPQLTSHLIAFGIFITTAQLAIVFTVAFRNRRDYSPSENAFLNISTAGIFILGTLFLSDVLVPFFPHLQRLGTLGGLLFTYFSLFGQALIKDRSFILRKIGKTFLFAAILLVPASLLFEDFSFDKGFRLFVFFVDVLMVFRIHSVIKLLDGEDDFFKFVSHFVENEKYDMESLKAKISHIFSGTEFKFLSAADLRGYDSQKMIAFFELNQTHLFRLEEIRKIIFDADKKATLPKEEVHLYEQIQHLLAENGMNYLCLLSAGSGDMLLLHIPFVAYNKIILTKTALVRDYAKFMERTKVI